MSRLRARIRLRPGDWGRDWIIFVMSLLLAAFVWFLSNLSQVYSGTISVPVIAVSNIEGHGVESSNTVVVSARCRTEGFRLVREQSRRKRKVVKVRFESGDLRRTAPDTYCIIGGIKNNYITQFFGEGTQVEAFITDTLRFVFPAENHKKVPVVVSQAVVCRSQYMLSAPFTVKPDSVTVYGEASRLEAIEKVTAPHLALTDVHETQHGVLRLNPIQGVRLSVDEVTYELPVSRYVELRTTLPLEVLNAPAGRHLQVYPPQAEVVLRCVFPITRDPLPSFKLYIDWNDFSASLTGRCAPRAQRLPAGVLEYRVSPEVFDCIELR